MTETSPEAKSIACLSVNALGSHLVEEMVAEAPALRVGVSRGKLGHLLIDAGQHVSGSIEAGRRIAEICMGGLGAVRINEGEATRPWRWRLMVSSPTPLIACLCSQYAGWNMSYGDGDDKYQVLGSGPGRAKAQKEPIYKELNYRDDANRAIFVAETDTPPPDGLVEQVAADCGVAPKDVVFIYAPTQSLAGSVQVVARVLEVALHKAHQLDFPLERIIDGLAAAPIAPPSGDFLTAMGRTNDAIIYGGHVQLFVTGPASDAEDLSILLPSQASRAYGRPFADLFKAVKGDFYSIDPMLFSPAAVTITAVESGRSYHTGQINAALIDASFR
ncbi:MAG: methenyltetrahydromethanopterin cyclohydrolase [Alphaproteobacteria bacterium]